MITLEQERAFYDSQYAPFLTLPPHALRINRRILTNQIGDPGQPQFERQLLYRATMLALEAEPLRGKKVLDYGCGPADFGLWMATEGADVTLLDLSPKAIELGLKRAAATGVNVRGIAADASRLTMLNDREFDVVFACAALHHTLKYPGAINELARVMKPAARLVLCETWGGNPLLNGARRLRSAISGEPEAQGEEIILSHVELRALDSQFRDFHVHTENFLAMGKRLLRGRFTKAWARSVLSALERTDSALFAIAPALRNWCGEAVITGRRRDW